MSCFVAGFDFCPGKILFVRFFMIMGCIFPVDDLYSDAGIPQQHIKKKKQVKMRIKKPEMKVIHFESGDIITTSAQPKDYFTFSGVSDGRAGNIKMIFNGENRTSQDNEIVSYLKNQHGPFDRVGFSPDGSIGSFLYFDNQTFAGEFSPGSGLDRRNNTEVAGLLNNTFYYYDIVDRETYSAIRFTTN